MRILLLAPLHEKLSLKDKEKNRHFPLGQGQQSWVEALEKLGHKINVFYYNDSIIFGKNLNINLENIQRKMFPEWYGKIRRIGDLYYRFLPSSWIMNKRIINRSHTFKPNQIWLSGGFQDIFPQSIKKIKENCKAKIFLLSGVNPVLATTPAEKEMVRQGVVDVVLENDEGYAKMWRELGAKKVIALPISSVDTKLHRKIKLSKEEIHKYGSDVVFVGTLWEDRQRAISYLLDLNIKIWGDIPRMGLSPKLKKIYQGEARGEKIVKIFNASKIILNFQPNDMIGCGNMRTFEIAGCGGFQVTNKINKRWFTKDKEIVIYKNVFELKKKIKFFLKNSRKRKEIALAGYKKAHRDHTYEKHFQRLLS